MLTTENGPAGIANAEIEGRAGLVAIAADLHAESINLLPESSYARGAMIARRMQERELDPAALSGALQADSLRAQNSADYATARYRTLTGRTSAPAFTPDVLTSEFDIAGAMMRLPSGELDRYLATYQPMMGERTGGFASRTRFNDTGLSLFLKGDALRNNQSPSGKRHAA